MDLVCYDVLLPVVRGLKGWMLFPHCSSLILTAITFIFIICRRSWCNEINWSRGLMLIILACVKNSSVSSLISQAGQSWSRINPACCLPYRIAKGYLQTICPWIPNVFSYWEEIRAAAGVLEMLSLDCFALLRRKSISEGVIARAHGRKAGEVLLSSLFLCPKTVPSRSEILSAALITFWMETVLSTACRQECSWWGCWEPKAWFVIGVGPFQMNHLDIVHLSLIDNCCNSYLQNLVSLFCFLIVEPSSLLKLSWWPQQLT